MTQTWTNSTFPVSLDVCGRTRSRAARKSRLRADSCRGRAVGCWANVVMDVRQILQANLGNIRASIDDASRGRQIALVCVTKYVDLDTVVELIDAGAAHLGENRIIEGAHKFDAARAAGRAFIAHMIGGIQGNKAAKIPPSFDWCQSLASEKVAAILDKGCEALGKTLQCTIEINVGSESQKDGVCAGELSRLVEFVISNCPRLNLRGLMCIPPVGGIDESRAHFARMYKLYTETGEKYSKELASWDTLSMGMSADYIYAIKEGATMVRVGSSLYRGLPGFE